jgi:hypothetical protein
MYREQDREPAALDAISIYFRPLDAVRRVSFNLYHQNPTSAGV